MSKELLKGMRELGVKWKRGHAIPTYPHTMTEKQKLAADKLYDSMTRDFIDSHGKRQ